MNRREWARKWAKLPTHFLNVDLDVHSSRPLDVLAQAMEKHGAHALHCERFGRADYRARFEVDKQRLDADRTIQEFGRVVSRLPAPARRLFDRAKLREFSIGIQAGKEPHAFDIAVSNEALTVVAAVCGRLSVTVYAPMTALESIAPPRAKARKRKTR